MGNYDPTYCRNPDDESTQSAGPPMSSYVPDIDFASVVDNVQQGVFAGPEGAGVVGPPNMNTDLAGVGKNNPRPNENPATTWVLTPGID